MLVINMVLVHSANMTLAEGDPLRYFIFPILFGFGSGAWIFISGFLIGSRYQAGFERDVRGTTGRLISRGLRILGIFLAVNLLMGKIDFDCTAGVFSGGCQPWNLLVLGQNQGMTFEILQGIAYVLITAPLFMATPRPATIGILLLVVVATIAHLLGSHSLGLSWMLLVGLTGLVMGWHVPIPLLHRVTNETDTRAMAFFLGVVLWLLFEVITFMRVEHDFIVGIYLVGIFGALMAMYAVSCAIPWSGIAARNMDRMAHYALAAYIGQMGILWIWHSFTEGNALLHSYPVTVVVVFVLMLVALSVLERLRRRVRLVDRAYRGVFG